MSFTADNWTEWFKSRPSSSMIDKENQERLFSNVDASVSKSNCLDAILTHEETVFLHKVNFGEKKVVLFHHLVVVGDTAYDSATKEFGMIQGIGKGTATKMTPDLDILLNIKSDSAITTATGSHLCGVSEVDNINELALSATIKYHPRHFVPVPPFLIEILHTTLSSSNGNAEGAFVATLEFDNAHSDDEDYKDKAKSKCKDIIS